jgi:CheY-like chemotaxis protein
MRVLLVEDDSATAQSIELMLKSAKFDVFVTDLGEEAIELGTNEEYDFILLDLNLPDKSGFDVLQTLRTQGIRTPVIIVSGLAGIDDITKGLRLGADDYITKPFHMQTLIARMNAVGRRYATSSDISDVAAASKSVEVNSTTVVSNITDLSSEYTIDKSNILPFGSWVQGDVKISQVNGIAAFVASIPFADVKLRQDVIDSLTNQDDTSILLLYTQIKRLIASALPPVVHPKWKDRSAGGGRLTPLEFIDKHYAVEIAMGTLTQRLRSDDPDLYAAFFNWRKTHKDVLRRRKGLTIVQLEEGADDWMAANSEATGRTNAVRVKRVRGTPVSETATAPARPSAHLLTARELFGDAAPTRQAKPRQKYKFAPELLADPAAVSAAESIANARTYKLRKGVELTPDEDARGKMAASFVKQAQRRRQGGMPSAG